MGGIRADVSFLKSSFDVMAIFWTFYIYKIEILLIVDLRNAEKNIMMSRQTRPPDKEF